MQEKMTKEYAVGRTYLRSLAEKTGGRLYSADNLSDVPQPSMPLLKNLAGNTVWVITQRARRRLVRHATSKSAPGCQTSSCALAKVMWRLQHARFAHYVDTA